LTKRGGAPVGLPALPPTSLSPHALTASSWTVAVRAVLSPAVLGRPRRAMRAPERPGRSEKKKRKKEAAAEKQRARRCRQAWAPPWGPGAAQPSPPGALHPHAQTQRNWRMRRWTAGAGQGGRGRAMQAASGATYSRQARRVWRAVRPTPFWPHGGSATVRRLRALGVSRGCVWAVVTRANNEIKKWGMPRCCLILSSTSASASSPSRHRLPPPLTARH
jgi:hypothetical protein